ncbi:MAG: helix-turn-helix transcriptional regulator [Elusimicrobia bacterium]|nr:helix-turn-helix transcriptional regulator [Elusimicrobiota bacterium]
MPKIAEDVYLFVGRRIREERKARGLTMEELASAAGMNTSFLHYIETGKKKSSLRMVHALARALGLDMESLFRGMPSASAPEEASMRKMTSILRDADAKTKRRAIGILKALVRGG